MFYGYSDRHYSTDKLYATFIQLGEQLSGLAKKSLVQILSARIIFLSSFDLYFDNNNKLVEN